MGQQKRIDEARGAFAPGFPVDGVEVAVEFVGPHSVVLHPALVFEDTRAYEMQQSAVIRDTGDAVRVGFPHRVVLYAPAGRTDAR